MHCVVFVLHFVMPSSSKQWELNELCHETFYHYTQTHVYTHTNIWQALIIFTITFILILSLRAMLIIVHHIIRWQKCKLPWNHWDQNTGQMFLGMKSKKLLKFVLKTFSPLCHTEMQCHCHCPWRNFLGYCVSDFLSALLKGF